MREYNGLSLCRYFPAEGNSGLQMLNFVYEPKPFDCKEPEYSDRYYLYLVAEGEGMFCGGGERYRLNKGDFFFIFPGERYFFEGYGWKIAYISYRGMGVARLYAEAGVSRENRVRRGYRPLVREWLREFNRCRGNRSAAMAAEALMLKTLSYFGDAAVSNGESDCRRNLAEMIAEYLDEHFVEPDITLCKLGEIFHFNANYISYTFKEYMNTGITTYLRQKRMHKACELLLTENISVKDVAAAVGFNDALYFERSFRKYTGLSPTLYRKSEHNA